MLPVGYVPQMPFEGYKWKWATLQCTEGINDPVVLLGVLRRMRNIEKRKSNLKYSSEEFANELILLSHDVGKSTGVDLSRRIGSRNIIRNSGQYWRALGLIPTLAYSKLRGCIELTDFGKMVADNVLSQAEFAAITIATFALPNAGSMDNDEIEKWKNTGIKIYPLRLILSILQELGKIGEAHAYITPKELYTIVIPLTGCCHPDLELLDYVNSILAYRNNEIDTTNWPDCIQGVNDHRIVREFLLFLRNYGYLLQNPEENNKKKNSEEIFRLNINLLEEISSILTQPEQNISEILGTNTKSIANIASDVERIRSKTRVRPNQARFRRAILQAYHGCIITNMEMPEILEAAHIVPFAYHGEDTIANGFAMRTDVHILFDSGHLRISPDGEVYLSDRARMDYGRSIPPRINIPDFVNREFIRWRWENPDGA